MDDFLLEFLGLASEVFTKELKVSVDLDLMV